MFKDKKGKELEVGESYKVTPAKMPGKRPMKPYRITIESIKGDTLKYIDRRTDEVFMMNLSAFKSSDFSKKLSPLKESVIELAQSILLESKKKL